MTTCGSIAAVLLGTIYALIIYYLPFVFINFIVTIFFGIFVGAAVGWAAKKGKVRNNIASGIFGLLFGIVALYLSWVMWFYAVTNYQILPYSPGDMAMMMSALAEEGHIWTLFSWQPQGFGLYSIWALEAAIICLGAWLSALGHTISIPFCEECQRWVEDKTSIFPLEMVGNTEEIKQQLERQDFAALRAMRRLGENSTQYSQLDLLHCPSCEDFHLLNLAHIAITTDDNGNPSRNEQFIVENLLIAKRSYDDLQSVGSQPAQGPTVDTTAEKKPVIADKKPSVFEIEPGTYYWCTCGKSQKQPYCDGSHKGSEFSPQKFEITEKKRVALCNCKYTKNGPFCDGTHSSL